MPGNTRVAEGLKPPVAVTAGGDSFVLSLYSMSLNLLANPAFTRVVQQDLSFIDVLEVIAFQKTVTFTLA